MVYLHSWQKMWFFDVTRLNPPVELIASATERCLASGRMSRTMKIVTVWVWKPTNGFVPTNKNKNNQTKNRMWNILESHKTKAVTNSTQISHTHIALILDHIAREHKCSHPSRPARNGVRCDTFERWSVFTHVFLSSLLSFVIRLVDDIPIQPEPDSLAQK